MVCSGVSVAEQKTTARAMITKAAHIGPTRHDFEVRGIVQRYTVIWELNVVRWWHDGLEAIGVAFPSPVFEKVSQNYRRPTTVTRKKAERRRRKEMEAEG